MIIEIEWMKISLENIPKKGERKKVVIGSNWWDSQKQRGEKCKEQKAIYRYGGDKVGLQGWKNKKWYFKCWFKLVFFFLSCMFCFFDLVFSFSVPSIKFLIPKNNNMVYHIIFWSPGCIYQAHSLFCFFLLCS